MSDYNKIVLLGRLTRDPQLRYVPSGAAVCDFRLATGRSYTSSDGKRHDETVFVDVNCWRNTAEACAKYLTKGRQVLVDGRLAMDEWETPEGQKRSKLKVVAEVVKFLGKSGGGAGSDSSGANANSDVAPTSEGEEYPF